MQLNPMKNITNNIIQQIPQLKSIDKQALKFKRLGGLTNLVYRVEAAGQTYLLRLAGEGTENFIDRKVEQHNAQVAADADVSAAIHYFDANSGLMLAEFIEGETMSAEDFRKRKGAPARAGEIFKKLHRSNKTFEFRFELFSMIDDYLKTLADLNAELPEGYRDVVESAKPVRQALDQNPPPLAPCHCDPLAENFIDNGERMWMVDWEYSGMNDPLWDLGDLSVEAQFSDAQDAEMLAAYCDGNISFSVQGRLVIYKAMSDLLWTLWGLVQHANNNPADDFWAYSIARFERCKALMAQEQFSRHIKSI